MVHRNNSKREKKRYEKLGDLPKGGFESEDFVAPFPDDTVKDCRSTLQN
jgi:hypothetical protein